MKRNEFWLVCAIVALLTVGLGAILGYNWVLYTLVMLITAGIIFESLTFFIKKVKDSKGKGFKHFAEHFFD